MSAPKNFETVTLALPALDSYILDEDRPTTRRNEVIRWLNNTDHNAGVVLGVVAQQERDPRAAKERGDYMYSSEEIIERIAKHTLERDCISALLDRHEVQLSVLQDTSPDAALVMKGRNRAIQNIKDLLTMYDDTSRYPVISETEFSMRNKVRDPTYL